MRILAFVFAAMMLLPGVVQAAEPWDKVYEVQYFDSWSAPDVEHKAIEDLKNLVCMDRYDIVAIRTGYADPISEPMGMGMILEVAHNWGYTDMTDWVERRVYPEYEHAKPEDVITTVILVIAGDEMWTDGQYLIIGADHSYRREVIDMWMTRTACVDTLAFKTYLPVVVQ